MMYQRDKLGVYVGAELEALAEKTLAISQGWDLENLNKFKRNFPAADLATRDKRICIQVTLHLDKAKFDDTLAKFDPLRGVDPRVDKDARLYVMGLTCSSRDAQSSWKRPAHVTSGDFVTLLRPWDLDPAPLLELEKCILGYVRRLEKPVQQDHDAVQAIINAMFRKSLYEATQYEEDWHACQAAMRDVRHLLATGEQITGVGHRKVADPSALDQIYRIPLQGIELKVSRVSHVIQAAFDSKGQPDPMDKKKIDRLRNAILRDIETLTTAYNLDSPFPSKILN